MNSKLIINPKCKGCYSISHNSTLKHCTIAYNSIRSNVCPCQECIVKNMCNIGCEEYGKFNRMEKGYEY